MGNRPKAVKKEQEESPKLSVTVKGVEYSIAFDDVTGVEAREFRLETGFTIHSMFFGTTGVIDALEWAAAIVWFNQRREDPNLHFLHVLKTLAYEHLVDGEEGASEEGSPPG